MSAANVQEALVYWGKKKQTAVGTANTTFWRLHKTNAELANASINVETDAAWIGKGVEFATATYPSHKDVSFTIEKYLSSEWAAWLSAFSLGSVVETIPEAGAYQYVCTPLIGATSGIEVPAFSYVEQIRPGASEVLDRMLTGCAVNEATFRFESGPGLRNSMATANIVGIGKVNLNSGKTDPGLTTEHRLNGASMACTIVGNNYVSAKKIVSIEFGWRNNIRLDTGFYPGSGTEDNFAIRGRMEFGDRECFLRFVVRYENGSDELATLMGLTTGTATISVTGDLIVGATYNKLQADFAQLGFQSAIVGNSDGIVTVEVVGAPQWSGSAILTLTATTPVSAICSSDT